MSQTPETDAAKFRSLYGSDDDGWRWGDVVPAAISRRMERERDALNTKCEQIGRQLVVAERERDEARDDTPWHSNGETKDEWLARQREKYAVLERELAEARDEVARLREALQLLADRDFVITPHDRMDAVRTIAREALAKNAETK